MRAWIAATWALAASSCAAAGPTPTLEAFDFKAADNLALSLDTRGILRDGAVHVLVPAGTDVTALKPRIRFDAASVEPADGAPNDFTFPATYTLRGASGVTASFTVAVFVGARFPAEITEFRGPEGGKAAIKDGRITLEVKAGTDLSAWRPTVAWVGESLDPASGAPRDFRTPVRYAVTAVDGTQRFYTVTVTTK
jgi:hypothetical protein